MKNQKGVTLVSLMITIILILIITGTTVYTSTNRFKINNLSKMQNDIELLNDKISSYYLKYGGLPILKDEKNQEILYNFSEVDFDRNGNDDKNYYIIDLEAMGNITLNYGMVGYKNPNTSQDVYIINGKTHSIYYVQGIEYTNGMIYHTKEIQRAGNPDNVPPTKPQIKIIAGTQSQNNENEVENNLYYTSDVTLEFISGKDNWSGVDKTTYSINEAQEIDISTLTENRLYLSDNGTYKISLRTYDNKLNYSETILTIYINK